MTDSIPKTFLDKIPMGGQIGLIASSLAIIQPLTSCLKTTLLCPFERCQVVLQTQSQNILVKEQKFEPYKGGLDYFKRIFKLESPKLMWRGNMIQMFQCFIPYLQVLPSLLFINQITRDDGKGHFKLDLSKNKLFTTLDVLYFTAMICINYPVDLVRIRIMSDIGPQREFQGYADCFRKIKNSDGPFGFYRGMIPHIITLPFLSGSQWGASAYIIDNYKDQTISTFLFSQSIMVISGLFGYPFLTVQRQMIMKAGREEVLFNGMRDCIKKTYKSAGIRGFYRGYLISLIQMDFWVAAISGITLFAGDDDDDE